MWVDYQWLDKAVQNKICADFPLSLHNVSYTVFLEVTISIWANLTRGVACSMQSKNPLRDAQAPVRGFFVFGCVSDAMVYFHAPSRRCLINRNSHHAQLPACKSCDG